MTLPTADRQFTTALRRAAVHATYAPSVHNTQPWRFHLGQDALQIYIDRSRGLPILDPTTRQMTISVGCALLNARVSLAAGGAEVEVARFPDRTQPDLAASITLAEQPTRTVDPDLAALHRALDLRQTNRRRFEDDDVPEDVLGRLEAAARAENAVLHVVRDPAERLTVAELSQRANEIENLNPAYRAELRAWTTADTRRRDGVPHLAVPHVDGSSGDEVPIRDFDTHGRGFLPAATHSSRQQCLVLLTTTGDDAGDWLRAGEALERVLLEVTRHGFTASPLTQVTEVPSARAELRRALRLATFPHVLVRIGRAPATPSSRRRRLVDVLTES